MANKVSLPSVAGLNTEGIPLNIVTFLQAVEDGIKTIDNAAVYKDAITIDPPNPLITASNAQGQAFRISGVSVASGEDYAVLVSNVQQLIRSHTQLAEAFRTYVNQTRGT